VPPLNRSGEKALLENLVQMAERDRGWRGQEITSPEPRIRKMAIHFFRDFQEDRGYEFSIPNRVN
jgi:hypothetical protein